MWTIRARNADLSLVEQVPFTQLVVVERFNLPDTASVTGTTRQLAPLLTPGMGALLHDDGNQRMSALVAAISPSGGGTATVTLASDLQRLWDRACYPDPAHAFGTQTADYDVRTGPAETLLLAYVNANAGPGALTDRRIPLLRLPVTAGRGPTTTVSARLDSLGQVVANLAETAGLRVRVNHVPGPFLDVVLDDVPDLSAWARFGTPESGGPGMVAPDWNYTLTAPTVTRSLVAAGGDGVDRLFAERSAPDAEALWGRRIEVILDQRQTTDPTEIQQAGDDALTDGSNPVSIEVSVLDTPGLRIGSDVPIGAIVQATLDGFTFVDRIREVTTTVEVTSDAATVTVQPTFGSADAGGMTVTQRQVASALKRISVIERAQ